MKTADGRAHATHRARAMGAAVAAVLGALAGCSAPRVRVAPEASDASDSTALSDAPSDLPTDVAPEQAIDAAAESATADAGLSDTGLSDTGLSDTGLSDSPRPPDARADAAATDVPDVMDVVVAADAADAARPPSTWALGGRVFATPMIVDFSPGTALPTAVATCPEGHVVVGLEGVSDELGGYLANVRPLCKRLLSDGSLSPVEYAAEWLPHPGPSRASANSQRCPAGQFAVGLTVVGGHTSHVADVLTGMGLQCGSLAGLQRPTNVVTGGNPGTRNTETVTLCPAGSALDEVRVEHGAVIGRVEPHCRALVPTPCSGACPSVTVPTCGTAGVCRTTPGWRVEGDLCAWESPSSLAVSWTTGMLLRWEAASALELFSFPLHGDPDLPYTRAEVVLSQTGADCPRTGATSSLWLFCERSTDPGRGNFYSRDFASGTTTVTLECPAGSKLVGTQGSVAITGDCTRTITVRRFFAAPSPAACAAVR